MPPTATHFHKSSLIFILLILVFSTFSKIFLFDTIYNQSPASIQQNDTARYETPALQLLAQGTLAVVPMAPQTTTLSTTPVYSLFIAGVYKVFGVQNHYALMVIQILLSTLSVFILFLIAYRLWGTRVALIAASFMAIAPLQILYSQLILSETLFTLLFITSLLAFTYLITSPHKFTWAFILGIFITLATMTRPISYYLVFCIILGIIIFKQRFTQSWSQLIIISLLILLPFLLVTHAWKVRNEKLTGVYALNNAMSETMLYWKAKGVIMIGSSLNNDEAQQEIVKRLPTNLRTPLEQATAETKLAKEIILGDLGSYLKLTINGLKGIILGPGLSSQGGYYDLANKGRYQATETTQPSFIRNIEEKTGYQLWYLSLILYSSLLLLLSYLFSTYGFYRAIKTGSSQATVVHILMLGVIAYIILISTGHIAADSRMRSPITPIFLLYAAYGISEFTMRRKLKDKSYHHE
ncbi:MAG: glycosyltransferase family 39 protein [Methylococcaceae bacterium]